MTNTPAPGTYGALTRSTEEEHQAFMKALDGLLFTKEEFTLYGPGIVLIKAHHVLDALRQANPVR